MDLRKGFLVPWLLGMTACAGTPAPDTVPETAPPRSEKWATPLFDESVPNLHRVDEGVYRSAQPSAEGMEFVELLGVKTVLDLRSFHSDADEIEGTELVERRLPLLAWHVGSKDVLEALRILVDPAQRPVLVHCQHGADRTGLVCAAYRVVVQGWSKEDAASEMQEGGFGFHPAFANLVQTLEELDVETIRQELGIEDPAVAAARAAVTVVAVFDGREITEADLEEASLSRRIIGPLMERYRVLHGIEVTPSERESLRRSLMPPNPQLDELRSRLDAEELEELEQYEREFADGWVLQWKTNRQLHAQYGGRVIWQQFDPLEPVDAEYAYLREQERAGVFRIDDPRLAEEFWHYYLQDHDTWVIPEEEVDFSRPWWEREEKPSGDGSP